MGALCAFPALVQPASSQQVDSVEEVNKMLSELVTLLDMYCNVILAVDTGELTAAEAVNEINFLTEKTISIENAAKKIHDSLSPEEKERSLREFGEILASFVKLEPKLSDAEAKLLENNYYNSPELKAACEKYLKRPSLR